MAFHGEKMSPSNRKAVRRWGLVLAAVISIGAVPAFATTETEVGSNGTNGSNGVGGPNSGGGGNLGGNATANATSTDATNTAKATGGNGGSGGNGGNGTVEFQSGGGA